MYLTSFYMKIKIYNTIIRLYGKPVHWPNELGVRQWSVRSGFSFRSSHTKGTVV